MRRVFQVIGWAMVVSAWLTGVAVAGASAAEIAWLGDYALARQQASQSGRPVVIAVSSRGCGWCLELDRTTFRDPRVIQELNGQTIPLKIDMNDPAYSAVVEALGVQGVPTLAVIAPDGRIVANRSGYLDAPQFLAWLRPVVGSTSR
ncbi:hypothetical protein BH23PLA1_BH23PLA1_03200 [soil metagenome]